jgi:hypothetical protein
MKKKYVLLILLAITIIGVAFAWWAIYTSFVVVKPTTQMINDKLASTVFSKIVRIPQGIPRPSYDFAQTGYFWEMETNSKEVTGVHFNFTPAFGSNDNDIIVTLEMPENSDPSIFTKVLPAVISDEQTLKSSVDPLKQNLNGNKNAGYEKIALIKDNKNNQTIKIIWKYSKGNLPEEIKKLYSKLNYPQTVLKTFYKIPDFLLSLARG